MSLETYDKLALKTFKTPLGTDKMRSVFKAIGMMSTASLVGVLISTLTNKIIAVGAGPNGVAWMGLYRNLGAFITGILSFGYSILIMQQISVKQEIQERVDVLWSTVLLFAIQLSIAICTLILFAEFLSKWMFADQYLPTQVFNARIVIIMATLNIALELINSIFRGLGAVRTIVLLQWATSLSTLILIYPLLQLGSTGLAINVGSGGTVAVVLGLYILYQRFSPHFSKGTFDSAKTILKRDFRKSFLILIQCFVSFGGLITIQRLINKHFGMTSLGNYNAVWLLLDTSILVLMSSMRAYFLPELGKQNSLEEKNELFSTMLTVFVVAGTLIGAVLIVGSPLIVTLLFSSKFDDAIRILPLIALAIPGTVICWCANTYLLHFNQIKTLTFIDISWMLLSVGFGYLVCQRGWGFDGMPLAYSLALTLGGTTYLVILFIKYGKSIFQKRNVFLLMASPSILLLGVWITQKNNLFLLSTYITLGLIVPFALFVRYFGYHNLLRILKRK